MSKKTTEWIENPLLHHVIIYTYYWYPAHPTIQEYLMRFKPSSLFLALICLAVAVPAQASMHPNAAVDGWLHFMWHMQMTWHAAQTSNWAMFWQLFTEQSVCTSAKDFTFVFTPAFFTLVSAMLTALIVMLAFRILRKMQVLWWTKLHRYAY